MSIKIIGWRVERQGILIHISKTTLRYWYLSTLSLCFEYQSSHSRNFNQPYIKARSAQSLTIMVALDIGLQGRVISIFSYMKEILKYASIMNLVCLLTNFLFNP